MPMKGYLFLLAAILFEIGATTTLRMTEPFTRPVPSILTVIGYGAAFYCLTSPCGLSLWASLMPSGRSWASSSSP